MWTLIDCVLWCFVMWWVLLCVCAGCLCAGHACVCRKDLATGREDENRTLDIGFFVFLADQQVCNVIPFNQQVKHQRCPCRLSCCLLYTSLQNLNGYIYIYISEQHISKQVLETCLRKVAFLKKEFSCSMQGTFAVREPFQAATVDCVKGDLLNREWHTVIVIVLHRMTVNKPSSWL